MLQSAATSLSVSSRLMPEARLAEAAVARVAAWVIATAYPAEPLSAVLPEVAVTLTAEWLALVLRPKSFDTTSGSDSRADRNFDASRDSPPEALLVMPALDSRRDAPPAKVTAELTAL